MSIVLDIAARDDLDYGEWTPIFIEMPFEESYANYEALDITLYSRKKLLDELKRKFIQWFV